MTIYSLYTTLAPCILIILPAVRCYVLSDVYVKLLFNVEMSLSCSAIASVIVWAVVGNVTLPIASVILLPTFAILAGPILFPIIPTSD